MVVFPTSMPVRLSQFYALVLLLTCLGVNIAFFSEVREPFLGSEDPLASVKSSFSELDIRGKIAGFYGTKPENVDDIQDLAPSEPPKEEPRTPKEQRRKTAPQPAEPKNVVARVDPFLLSEPLPKAEPEKPAPREAPPEPSEPVPVVAPAGNLQTAATIPAPLPAVAAVKSAVAEQFKPIVTEPKSALSVKPSSQPVWETIDTVLERPVWYE